MGNYRFLSKTVNYRKKVCFGLEKKEDRMKIAVFVTEKEKRMTRGGGSLLSYSPGPLCLLRVASGGLRAKTARRRRAQNDVNIRFSLQICPIRI